MKRSPKSWHRPFHPLNEYVQFKSISILEDYLLDKLDFYGASLKFKARSNTLALDRKKCIWDQTKHLKKSNAACFYTPVVLKLLIIVQIWKQHEEWN